MGERHIFVRFTGCDVRCGYCDEHQKTGVPMSVAGVVKTVMSLESDEGPHAFVSLTGGEPLKAASFVASLAGALRARGFRILLETNGIEWQALSPVLERCDSISMDIKIPSVGGHPDFYEAHRRFLEAARTKEINIKIVVSSLMDQKDFEKHVRMIADMVPETTVFIQPVWREMDTAKDYIESVFEIARRYLRDVRLGFQLHKMLGMS
ncbi:MAG: pyruvate formate lyase-activating enzyme 1 [Candidatus Omnitrophica bacterium ADurb.Bin277]|nr:MAG: pyruvate formate lyase-activating enzyme 1 [Candidatus Omnitrophica bacterium ADurb.Bin277]